ncbi:MAG: Fe-S cluster assembly protein NifU [bacterium]|nr:Fe-S cluster assembly protein NifU [bacterium]
MWEYTDKVKEYYTNPKNVGEIENPDAVGEAGSLVCGDMLKIFLKIDKNGIITDAKFQTFGCGSAIASSSALTEMIIGKSIDEADKLTNQDIVEFLGGLPNEKIHCSVMGREALDDAIANYKGIEKKEETENHVICTCFNIKEDEIRALVREKGVTDIYEAAQYSKVSSACGKCREEVSAIILDELKKKNEKPVDKMTKTQLVLKINKVIEGYISEHLRKDGGDIELVDVKKGKVYVRLCGTCGKCAMSSMTLKNFVEKTLKEQVSEEIEVISV